jgi:hypothetical protein
MFRILPPLILKVLVPALLTVVLVIAGAVVSQSQVRSIPAVGKVVNVSQVDRSSVAAEVKPIQSSPATEQKVDYDLIIKDIVQIFKWMETPGMTPIELAANIRGHSCDSSVCSITISKEDIFHTLNSDKYLGEVKIYTKQRNINKVGSVHFELISPWNEIFSPVEFIKKLSEGIGKPKREDPPDRDCIAIRYVNPEEADDHCLERLAYSVNIKKKYFNLSKFKTYSVRTDYFLYRDKKPNVLIGMDFVLE